VPDLGYLTCLRKLPYCSADYFCEASHPVNTIQNAQTVCCLICSE